MEDRSTARKMTAIWQIYLPLVIGSLAVLVLGLWAVVAAAGGTDVSRFADTSTVFLLIPVLVFSLIPLALLVGMIYGVIRLIEIIPPGTQRILAVVERLQRGLTTVSEKAVQPILWVESVRAGLKGAFKRTEKSTIEK